MGRQFGAVYLILGTCVAAGMLGLPVVVADNHFSLTLLMLISAWLMMSVGAWCLVKVLVDMPSGVNLLSMASQTLGPKIKWLTWVVYLLLFYSLIAAYLSASGDLLAHFAHKAGLDLPRWCATVVAVLILGGIVMHGIRSVDWVNRILMSLKLIICLLTIAAVLPFVHLSRLSVGHASWHGSAWLIMVCSFGYATILPSIRDYLGGDNNQLKRIFLIGSFLPLLLYIVWIFAVQGAVSHDALVAMNHSADTNSRLMSALASLTDHPVLQSLSVVFISICSITGFFGVSLGLVDFIADGIGLIKKGRNLITIALIAFLPSTLTVIMDPSIFIRALSYAGLCCLYILVVLPVAMYVAKRVKHQKHA